MGRKTQTEAALEAALLNTVDSPEEQEFHEFIENVGPGISRIDIYEMQAGGRRPFRDSVVMADLSENPAAFLRQAFGPGRYYLQFKGPDGKIRATKNIDVGEGMRKNGSTDAPQPNGNGKDLHLEFMREQMAMQQNMITALITSMKPPAPPDLGALFAGVAAIMKPPPSPPMPDPSAMLTAVVTAVATLRGNREENPLDFASKVIAMARDLQPPQPASEGEANVWSVVRDMGKHLSDKLLPSMPMGALQQPIPNDPHAIPQRVEIPAPQQSNPPQVTNDSEQAKANMLNWIKAGMAYLKQKAKVGKEPDMMIDWIFENQDEPQWQAILYAIRQGVTFEQILQFDPEISQTPHLQDWFKALYDGIHAEFNAPVDSSGQTGHATDTRPDAKPSDPSGPSPGDTTTGNPTE